MLWIGRNSPHWDKLPGKLPWWRWRSKPCHDPRSSCWGLSQSSTASCTPCLTWWTSWPCNIDWRLSWAELRGCWQPCHSEEDTPSLVSESEDWPRNWRRLPHTLALLCTILDTRTETDSGLYNTSLLCNQHLSASQKPLDLKIIIKLNQGVSCTRLSWEKDQRVWRRMLSNSLFIFLIQQFKGRNQTPFQTQLGVKLNIASKSAKKPGVGNRKCEGWILQPA